ncbi:MAG: DNA replication/repair protein RecF [Gammaproteobacteria bacterium]|jgi:DNA replication and repair protein RecF|nr:DNA replication/repair protein RecF [Gammaproteobacteria bacterium]
MTLKLLKVHGFRNLQSVNIELDDQINLIVGQNGAGKTSLLEAIYFLMYGKSPRTHLSSPLIQQAEGSLSITGLIAWHQVFRDVRVMKNNHQSVIELDGKRIQKRSEVATLLPVQFFDATTYRHLASGPAYRREFLDWGVFHVEIAFKQLMQNYKRSLFQRNMALKKGLPDSQIEAWDVKLAESGMRIDQMRQSYFEMIEVKFRHYWQELGHGHLPLEMSYLRGWEGESVDLPLRLKQELQRDRRIGFTQVGIHRADLKVSVYQEDAFNFLSQGQQKIMAYALYLAQLSVLQTRQSSRGLFLVDDLPAELDLSRQEKLVEAMLDLGSQLLVSGIYQDQLVSVFKGRPMRVFRVDHGQLQQM